MWRSSGIVAIDRLWRGLTAASVLILGCAWLSLLPIPARAAVTDLHIITATNNQIGIGYTAPDSGACTVEASEDMSYSPLAYDVDPALFADADTDLDRYPTLQSGTTRQFVIGTREYERALNDRIISRGLRVSTTYYIRVTCGVDSATISQATTGLPFGMTYVDAPQLSTEFPGRLTLPTIYDQARGAEIIDPMTGTTVIRVSRAGDLDQGGSSGTLVNLTFSSVESSTNWTNPNDILTDNATSTTYSAATSDWLLLRKTASYNSVTSADYVKLYLEGSGDDATAANRTMEWRIKLNSESCDDADKITYELVLPQTTPAVVSSTPTRGDMGRLPTAYRQPTAGEIRTAGILDICVRKKTGTGSISMDFAKFDLGGSQYQSTGSGGNPSICSDVVDGSGFFTCTSNTGGGPVVLYKLKVGEAPRYLGFPPSVGGGICTVVAFSPVTANRMYCAPSSTGALYQVDYTGDSTNKTAPYTAEISSSALSTNLTSAVDTFVAANSGHYTIDFDATKFGCSAQPVIQGNYVMILCWRGQQNSYAWLAVWEIGTGIVGAYFYPQVPPSRWCGMHSVDENGQQNAFTTVSHFFAGGAVGYGRYLTTLDGAIDATQTTIRVAGQPVSSDLDTTLFNWADGDTIRAASETMTISDASGFPDLVVVRGVDDTLLGATNGASHSNGATVEAFCASSPTVGYYQTSAPMTGWDYIDDPFGEDTTGVDMWANRYIGHFTARGNRAVNNNLVAIVGEGTNIMESPLVDYDYSVAVQPPFASRIPPAAGVSYQTHATWHNVLGTAFSEYIFEDSRPFLGGNLFSENTAQVGCDPTKLLPTSGGCAAQRVSGTSNTYKYTFSGSDRPEATLAYRQMPVWAVAGFTHLTNISGPSSAISDATPYTFCVVLIADECRTGSSPGDMFLSAPGVTKYFCEVFGSATDLDLCIMERSAGTLGIAEHNMDVPGTESIEMRDLIALNTRTTTARYSIGDSVKHAPDGSFTLFTMARDERSGGDLFMAVTPPILADAVDRSTFIPQTITIDPGDVPAMTSRAFIRYGLDANLYGSGNRLERCNAVAATVSESTVCAWDSELTASSGVSCASGCDVVIPAIPQRVTWHQTVFRDAGGSEISAGPVVLDGEPPPAPPPSSTSTRFTGNVNANGNIATQ